MAQTTLKDVPEGSTAYLTVSFYDQNWAPALPSAASYRITDDSGTSIRAETSLTPGYSVTITLAPSDHTLSGSSDRVNVVTVKATISSQTVVSEYKYNVKALVGYPFP